MVVKRGEVWWASLAPPRGSEPGYARPILVVQSDRFNRSRLRTIVAATITTNLGRAEAPGNVFLPKRVSKLPRDSVVNVSQLATIDKEFLTKRVGRLPTSTLREIEDGIKLVLDL